MQNTQDFLVSQKIHTSYQCINASSEWIGQSIGLQLLVCPCPCGAQSDLGPLRTRSDLHRLSVTHHVKCLGLLIHS
jgi:hypothetical protein